MKKYLIIFFAFFIFGSAFFFYAHFSKAKSQPFVTQKVELDSEKLWLLVQTWRIDNDLKPYEKDQRLCDISNDRVKDGLDYHKGLHEKYANLPYYISENSGIDYNSEKDLLTGWLYSVPHADALKHSYKYSCISCSNDFCVQIFSNF